MKLFNKYYQGDHNVYVILGLFKIRIRSNSSLRAEVKFLRMILSNIYDVRNFPKAQGELRDYQLEEYSLLKDFDAICRKNNLKYWLDGGSLLGAIRHEGFIPWDDDIDICMMREEFYKVIPLLKEHFKDSKYFIKEKHQKYKYYNLRIVRKDFYKIGLDIFPIDEYYRDGLTQSERLEISEKIRKTRLKLSSNIYHRKDSVEKVRKLVKDYENKYILKSNPSKQGAALYAGLDFPWGSKYQIWNFDDIFPLRETKFEDGYFYVPNKAEDYLKDLYGNYMQLPRVIHEKGYRF